MKTLSYSQKLKDPRWQKVRLKVFERDNWTCCECDSQNDTLNVHHKFYFRRYKNPWDYPLRLLETLCHKCHENRGAAIDTLHSALVLADTGNIQIWAKRITREHSDLKEKMETVQNPPAQPMAIFVAPLSQKTVWEQMRAAANGLIALNRGTDAK